MIVNFTPEQLRMYAAEFFSAEDIPLNVVVPIQLIADLMRSHADVLEKFQIAEKALQDIAEGDHPDEAPEDAMAACIRIREIS